MERVSLLSSRTQHIILYTYIYIYTQIHAILPDILRTTWLKSIVKNFSVFPPLLSSVTVCEKQENDKKSSHNLQRKQLKKHVFILQKIIVIITLSFRTTPRWGLRIEWQCWGKHTI